MIRLLFFFILLITGAIDAATGKIHDISPLLVSMLAIWRLACDPGSLRSCIIGFFILSIPMLLLALLRGGLGGGDIKLTAACGLFLGADALLTGFFIAALLALTVRLTLKLTKKADTKNVFALGPYLAVGFILASFL